jgi:hypothetical protein
MKVFGLALGVRMDNLCPWLLHFSVTGLLMISRIVRLCSPREYSSKLQRIRRGAKAYRVQVPSLLNRKEAHLST